MIHHLSRVNIIMLSIIPHQHRGLIDQHLPPRLRREARGLYSTTLPSMGLPVANSPSHLTNLWLSVSPTYRTIVLPQKDVVAALMFVDLEGKARILSAPTIVPDPDPTVQPYVIGHLGDHLASPLIVRMHHHDVTGNFVSYVSNAYATAHVHFATPTALVNPVQPPAGPAYDLPAPPVYQGVTPPDAHVGYVPTVLSLPVNHGIPEDLDINDPELSRLLPLMSRAAADWLMAVRHQIDHHNGQSLLDSIPEAPIVAHLRTTLPAPGRFSQSNTVRLGFTIVNQTDLAPQRLIEDLTRRGTANFDSWTQTKHALIRNTIVDIEQLLQTTQLASPSPVVASPAANKPRYTDSILSHRLMGTTFVNAAAPLGDVLPAIAAPLATVFSADSVGVAIQRLRKALSTLNLTCQRGATSHLAFSVKFPSPFINHPFASAVLNAHYFDDHLYQQSTHQRKTMLTIAAFRPANPTDSAHKALLDEADRLIHQDSVCENARHTTPVSNSWIFVGGKYKTHQNLVQTVANVLAYFACFFMGNLTTLLDKTKTHPVLITILLTVFEKVTSIQFEEWMTSMLDQAPYLVVTMETEIHNLIRLVISFATDPTNLDLLRNNQAANIDFTPLRTAELHLQQFNQRIDQVVSSGSLGPYVSAPKHYDEMIARIRGAGPGPNRSATPRSGEEPPPKKPSPVKPKASDPTKGFLVSTGGGSLPPSPRLTTNQQICYPYAIRGRFCSRVRGNCPFYHVSNPRGAFRDPRDRRAINQWVANCPHLDWAQGCGPIDEGPSQSPASAAPAATPASNGNS